MDWSSINKAAKTWSQPSLSTNTVLDILAYRDVLIAFLTNLLKELKHCKTVKECATLHPQAGPLLTSLSQNKVLLLDPTTCTLVASCLFEYCKTWDAVETNLSRLDKSKLWCIHRLRQLFRADSNDTHLPIGKQQQGSITLSPAGQLTNTLGIEMEEFSRCAARETADTVSRYLEQSRKMGHLVASLTLHRLSIFCIPLLYYPDAYPLILNLVQHAVLHDPVPLQGETESDPVTPLSPAFVEHLVFRHRGVLYDEWDIKFKVGLCLHFPFVLEYELLTLLTPVLFPPTQPYTPPPVLRRRLSSSWLVHEMVACPTLFWRAFEILATLVGEYAGDWRIVRVVAELVRSVVAAMGEEWERRLGECTLAHLLPLMRLLSIVDRPSAPQNLNRLLDDARRQAVYSAFPSGDEAHRRQTWMALVALPGWRRLCATELVLRMVTGDSVYEDDELAAMTRFIAWVACPTDDDRLDTLSQGLKRWVWNASAKLSAGEALGLGAQSSHPASASRLPHTVSAGPPSAHILSHFRLGWVSFADHAPVLLADVAVELARLCRNEAGALERIVEVLVSGFYYENGGNSATKNEDTEWKSISAGPINLTALTMFLDGLHDYDACDWNEKVATVMTRMEEMYARTVGSGMDAEAV